MMSNKQKEKNGDLKKIVIISGIALAVIATVLFFSFALPFIQAVQHLEKRIDAFEAVTNDDILQISDPYNSDASVLPTTVDIMLSGNEAQSFTEEFLSAINDIKYSGSERSIHGFWDVSISLRTNEKMYTVYLCEDSIYVSEGTKKYDFKMIEGESTQKYTDFYEKVTDMLSEQAKTNK